MIAKRNAKSKGDYKMEAEAEIEKTVNGNGKVGEIYGLMGKINAEIEAIGKGRRNVEQNYAFRGIDDVYNMLHPLFAKYGVFTLPRVLSEESAERPTRSGGIMRFSKLTMAYDFFASDGSHVTVETVGEAMDTADKASNKAMSAAHKYGLLQTFCIPTGETPEADYNTPEDVVGDPRPTTRNSTAQQQCPECQGAMWDNRESKRNPKAPDYKCKDRGCNGAIWMDKVTPQLNAEGDSTMRQEWFTVIKGAGKTLNSMGDSVEWTLANCNAFANENFNVTGGVDALTIPQLGELAKLMSARIDDLKAKKKGTGKLADSKVEAERQHIINHVTSNIAPALLTDTLNQKFEGQEIDALSLDALVSLQDELIPF